MKTEITLAVLLVSGTMAFAANNFDYNESVVTPLYQSPAKEKIKSLKDTVITVPAGEYFKAMTTAPLNSANLATGDNVTFVLSTDFYYNGQLVAPAGSSVTGMVLDVARAKHGSINGKLLLRFTQFVTPVGIQIPISAVVKTSSNNGVMLGGTKEDVTRDYVKDMSVSYGQGAAGSGVKSTMTAVDMTKGGTLSNNVGNGGGLLKSIWDKGYDVEIPASALLELTLTQPITINPEINKTNY